MGRGLRLWEQRTLFRRQTANDIVRYRYRDMAFRIFRNDALQKYRAQFEQAAQYAFLAARVYDYETNLLGDDDRGGRRFMNELIRERSLGVINNGAPYVGSGLAGKLAEMAANFNVLRTELGFNNKDHFQRTFSLRWERFRIPNGTKDDEAWRKILAGSIMQDLNQWEVYRQYAQPLLPTRDGNGELKREPAIVIDLGGTTLASGLNLFGKASNGDEILPPDRFAIKIHSFTIGLSQSYASPPLNRRVHAYLIPTGTDIMRVPTDGSIREWNVLDQTLPVPFPVSVNEIQQPDWMPWDALIGGSSAMAHRCRIPTATACPLIEEECDLNYKLIGRSLWNTQWYLVIPGSQLMGSDPDEGIRIFIEGEYGHRPPVRNRGSRHQTDLRVLRIQRQFSGRQRQETMTLGKNAL